MAFIQFYNTGVPCYRDENSNEDYEKMVHRFTSGNRNHRNNIPAANISETEKEFTLAMALPGVAKSDIRIEQEKEYLTVRIEKGQDEKQSDPYTRREFNFSGASRTFKTGDKIDVENITATHENGVLMVHLPKKAVVPDRVQSISIE
jgi:HSP20 family protein